MRIQTADVEKVLLDTMQAEIAAARDKLVKDFEVQFSKRLIEIAARRAASLRACMFERMDPGFKRTYEIVVSVDVAGVGDDDD